VPQPVYDAVDATVGVLADTIYSNWDPVFCELLVALAPGVPGLVDIAYDGDTRLLGGTVWECPPYDVSDPDPMSLPVPPECSDGVDNDLDGYVDYPADPDCWGPESDAEGLHLP
jgi:hypothetical protein